MASMRGKRFKNLRIHLTMLVLTYEFDKRLIYVGNDVYIYEFG